MAEIAGDGTHFQWSGAAPAAAVVLIHGLGLNRHMWQWQLPALTPDYKVLTYDLFGHGESPEPPTEPNLRLFSEQILRLLDQSHVEQCALIGFSLGGMIARRFALDHSGRLWALAVLHSPHDRTRAERDAVLARVEQARRDGAGATLEGALERWFGEDYRRNNPAMMARIRRWVMANDKPAYPEIYRVLAEGDGEIVAGLETIDCPTLVMTGAEDYGNTARMSENLAAAIPGAEVKILPGLRHMALAEAPDMVNGALLAFLGKACLEKQL